MNKPRWTRLPTLALTDTEHTAAANARGRPVTDDPIGRHTGHRRRTDADASEAMTHLADDTDTDRLQQLIDTRRRHPTHRGDRP